MKVIHRLVAKAPILLLNSCSKVVIKVMVTEGCEASKIIGPGFHNLLLIKAPTLRIVVGSSTDPFTLLMWEKSFLKSPESRSISWKLESHCSL